MLTLENFSEDNRSKVIGNSVYRIAADRYTGPGTVWHIFELYNNEAAGEFAGRRSCFSADLQHVIDIFNSITTEKEIINGKWKEARDSEIQ